MGYKAVRYFETVDPDSVEALKEEHGVDELTPELSRQVQVRQVRAGQDCSDLPEGKLRSLVASGYVVGTGEDEVSSGPPPSESEDEGDAPPPESAAWPDELAPVAAAGLLSAGIGPDDVATLTDDELLEVDGVGKGSLRVLREHFPTAEEADEEEGPAEAEEEDEKDSEPEDGEGEEE